MGGGEPVPVVLHGVLGRAGGELCDKLARMRGLARQLVEALRGYRGGEGGAWANTFHHLDYKLHFTLDTSESPCVMRELGVAEGPVRQLRHQGQEVIRHSGKLHFSEKKYTC